MWWMSTSLDGPTARVVESSIAGDGLATFVCAKEAEKPKGHDDDDDDDNKKVSATHQQPKLYVDEQSVEYFFCKRTTCGLQCLTDIRFHRSTICQLPSTQRNGTGI